MSAVGFAQSKVHDGEAADMTHAGVPALPAGLTPVHAPADVGDDRLRQIFEYWLSRGGEGRFPGRADFDPVEMPRALLPWITMFDVERDPLRFRVRLVGTGIVSAMDMDNTGRYLDEIDGIGEVPARASWLVGNRQPFTIGDRTMPWASDKYSRYAVIGLPLARNGADIDMIIYAMSFSY